MSDASSTQSTAATDKLDGDRPPAVAVAEAVASFTGRPPAELRPVEDAVDADALNDLVRSWRECDAEVDGSLVFTDGGCTVTVHSDGDIVVVGEADCRAGPIDEDGVDRSEL